MTSAPPAYPPADDSGFGMIEIVVSMFLVALMAMAMLPTLISSTRLTATNIMVTRATQVVGTQFDLARKQAELAPTCAAVRSLGTVAPISVVDPTGAPLRYTRTVGSCPATYPGTVSFSVTVALTSSGRAISTAKTLIAVASAN
jgi:type II secretory pathway pseudopilin PulG